jgi:hypothetical protein
MLSVLLGAAQRSTPYQSGKLMPAILGSQPVRRSIGDARGLSHRAQRLILFKVRLERVEPPMASFRENPEVTARLKPALHTVSEPCVLPNGMGLPLFSV